MSAGQCPCGRPTDEGVRFCETCEPTPPPGSHLPCADPAPADDIPLPQAREYEALLFGARWTVGSDHPGCICANCKTDMWREYRETRSTELL